MLAVEEWVGLPVRFSRAKQSIYSFMYSSVFALSLTIRRHPVNNIYVAGKKKTHSDQTSEARCFV